VEHANAFNSERMLLLGRFLSSYLLGTRLPEEASNKVQSDSGIKSLARQVYQCPSSEIGPPGLLERSNSDCSGFDGRENQY